MNLGKNASYEDYALLDESRYPRTDEKIAEFWLNKYKESKDEELSSVYEDDDIKILAKNKPIYCSGWDGDGDEDNPDYNGVVLETSVTVKKPDSLYSNIKDGVYYLAVKFAQSYEYVETYYDKGSYWNPPESDGYYEPSGGPYIPEEWAGPELFNTPEEAIKAVKDCNRHNCMYEMDGVITDNGGDSIFADIGEPSDIYNWCDEAPINDPDGVYPSYHQKQMDIEAKIDELSGKY